MKLLIQTKNPPALIEVEDLPEGFVFENCCVQARVQGFFMTPILHVAYDNIGFMTMSKSPTITNPGGNA